MLKKTFKLLELPEHKIICDLNALETSLLHQKIIGKKAFLRRLYIDFYRIFLKEINKNPEGKYLEIGSGGGFLKKIYPNIITSDIIPMPNLDIHIDAMNLPFRAESLDGIFMLDTFHHIPNVNKFLNKANACLKQGGAIIMIEPANTPFSRFIYKNFHHEPFAPESKQWTFPSNGPMSASNQALPWIIFKRDIKKFTKTFPEFKIISYQNHTPFRYLLSGGLTLRQLIPAFMYKIIRFLELLLSPLNSLLGMFATIKLQKNSDATQTITDTA